MCQGNIIEDQTEGISSLSKIFTNLSSSEAINDQLQIQYVTYFPLYDNRGYSRSDHINIIKFMLALFSSKTELRMWVVFYLSRDDFSLCNQFTGIKTSLEKVNGTG